MLDFAGQLQAQGVRNYPQVSPRTLDIHVNWDGGMSWFALENSWHKMVQAPRPDKEPMLRDPRWRALAREEWDRVPRTMIPHKHADRIRLVSVTRPENERWVGATLADLVADRGGHPSDVLADWLLDNDVDAGIVGVGVANSDAGGVAETLTHPASVMANSDAGAHLQMMCAIGDTTLMLTRHVRDRGDLHRRAGRAPDDRAARRSCSGSPAAAGSPRARRATWPSSAWTSSTGRPDVFVTDLPEGARRLRRPRGRLPLHGRRRHRRPGRWRADRGPPGRRPASLSPRTLGIVGRRASPARRSCWASHSWCRAK